MKTKNQEVQQKEEKLKNNNSRNNTQNQQTPNVNKHYDKRIFPAAAERWRIASHETGIRNTCL